MYFGVWYFLNVQFNILNKQVYNYFPFPWFVSCIHLAAGLVIAGFFWGTKLVKFEKPSGEFMKNVTLVALLHAVGHSLTNVSFATVAVSFTHTIKTLEPVFSSVGSYLVNGQVYSLPVYLSLIPIMAGVWTPPTLSLGCVLEAARTERAAPTSDVTIVSCVWYGTCTGVAICAATELSFTWLGFSTAMASNGLFAARAIFSKKLMSTMNAINVYNYVSMVRRRCHELRAERARLRLQKPSVASLWPLAAHFLLCHPQVALLFCIPPVFVFEWGTLGAGMAAAAAKVGANKFYWDLWMVGAYYHLYNQVSHAFSLPFAMTLLTGGI